MTITAAKWMLKANQSDSDNNALVSKSVTISPANSGQITDAGADGTAEVRIVIGQADLNAVTHSTAWCALKVLASTGEWFELPETREPVRILPAVIQAVS